MAVARPKIDERDLPLLCLRTNPERGCDLTLAYTELRKHWMTRNPGLPIARLAEILEVDRQKVSQWATGSASDTPPWHVVMHLCHLLGFVVVMSPRGPVLYRDPEAPPAPAPAEPDTSGGTPA